MGVISFLYKGEEHEVSFHNIFEYGKFGVPEIIAFVRYVFPLAAIMGAVSALILISRKP